MDNPNPDSLHKILDLSKRRIDFFHDEKNIKNWYQGSETYFQSIITETEEAALENKKNNHVFLEDELGDVFWCFCCLLSALEREGKISEKDAVFRRAYDKFVERIGENADDGNNWEEIKILQKNRRLEEHKAFYGEDENEE